MEKRPVEGEIVPTTTDDHDPEHFAVLSQTETGKAPTGGSTSMPQLEAAIDGEQETTKEGSTVDPSQAENHRPEDQNQASGANADTSEPKQSEMSSANSAEASAQHASENSQESMEGAEARSESNEDAGLRAKIAACVEMATMRKALFSQYNKEGYDVAREIADLDKEPLEARDAYLQTLFGKKDDPLASIYRTVGRCSFLYEEETLKVMKYMPIHVAVRLARKHKDPELQRAVLDHYRNHPDQSPTKDGLPKVIRSLESSRAKEKEDAKPKSPREIPEGAWATMTFTPARPLNEWQSETEAIALLQRTSREAATLGLTTKAEIRTADPATKQ